MQARKRLFVKARPLSADDGIAVATVMIIGSVLVLLFMVLAFRVSGDLGQTRRERQFEQALHVGESGIDDTVVRLRSNNGFSTGDVLPPSFPSQDAERDWVLGTASGKLPVAGTGGEWVVVKPSNSAVMYAVGYVPTKASPAFVRIVRAAYDFAPFVPDAAILVDGHLEISGNPTVSGDKGSAHANTDVELDGNPEFEGHVSASGSFSVSGSPVIGDPANSGGGKPKRSLPDINPLDKYPHSEYDLCSDGTVRAGPMYAGPQGPSPSSTVPCVGPSLADANSAEFRGWKKSGDDASLGAKWDYGANRTFDGVYYIQRGSAKISGTPGTAADPWDVTILAEASATGSEPGHCPHVGGDIEVSGNPIMRFHAGAQPLLLIAGRDLKISGNPGAGAVTYEGVMAAHEGFRVSGNPSIRGVLIAEAGCNTSGSSVDDGATSSINGNPSIHYDGQLSVPLGTTLRITHWQEM